MSLKDVFSGRQSLISWITGRDPKESDVYANYDKVAIVSDSIRSISKNQVATAQENIYAAFEQLNNVKGLAEYVGTIEISNYDTVFETISTTVEEIANQLDGKAEDIKIYEEAPALAKIGSSLFMGVCKVGEGLLSVAEDLGDGVVSLAGFTIGALNKDFQNDCANFIKQEWSHDLFNAYYNSDFAKMSIFTEDSAISGGFKIAGKAIGYLYAGGVLAGQTGLSAASQALKAGGKVGKVAGTMLKAASSSTWGATMAGALGGLGSGTESGLNSDMTFNQAFGRGAVTGLVQGGLAFAGGKLGEKLAKNAAVKEAKAAADQADDALSAAQKSFKEADEALKAANKKLENLYEIGGSDKAILAQEASIKEAEAVLDSAKTTLVSAQEAAHAANAALKSTGDLAMSSFQGYSDSITQAGERFGEASRNFVADGAHALKTTASASHAIRHKAADAGIKSAQASQAQAEFKESLKTLASENPVSQGFGALKGAYGKAVTSAKEFRTAVHENGLKSTVGAEFSAAKGSAAAAINNIKETGILGATKAAVQNMSPAVPGVAAVTLGSTVNETVQRSAIDALSEKDVVNRTGLQDLAENADELARNSIKTTPLPDNPVPPTTGGDDTVVPPPATTVPDTTAKPTDGGGNNGGVGGSNYQDPVTTPPTSAVTTPPTTVPPTSVTVPPTTAPPADTTTPPEDTTVTPIVIGGDPTDGGPYTEIITTTGDDGSHSGVGYDGETMDYDSLELENAESLDLLDDLDMDMEDSTSSIDEIVKGSKYTKIPTSSKPMTTTNKKSSNSVIPIAAGLSVAAAAGIGAKAYMDRKRNNETGEYDDEEEYEDDDFSSEEWYQDDDTVEVNSDEPVTNEDAYLEEEGFNQNDDYSYTARSANELADVQ